MGKKFLGMLSGIAVAILLFLALSVVGTETKYLVFGADTFVMTVYCMFILLIGSIVTESVTGSEAKEVIIDLFVAFIIGVFMVSDNTKTFGPYWINEQGFYELFNRIIVPIVFQMLFSAWCSTPLKKSISEWGSKE